MTASQAQQTESSELSRAVLIGSRPTPSATVRQRWAIIVGISRYKHPELNLRHAHRDAEELYRVIKSPRGGGFDEERICRLINEEASTENIYRVLRGFLKRPGREDLVLIFLACHGAPDPDRPANVYLITYDTDPDDVASTAVPMEHIQQALEPRNLFAERVILIADTCHSAALGGSQGQRRVIGETAAANRYLQTLGAAKPGLAVLTSAEVNETSLEDTRWGGGHGVFTYHLLEGLRGKADKNTGIVTVGALFDYVREQVRQDTGDQQHPVIGSTAFDRDLPLAITGDISANDYFLLGRNLLWLGRLLDDRKRYLSAIRQLEEALRFAGDLGQPLPEARLHLGQARLAAGDVEGALRAFEQASADLDGELLAEAYFYQIMAKVRLYDIPAAQAAIPKFLSAFPDDWRVAWLRDLEPVLENSLQSSTGRALLIGIGQYTGRIPPLRGPANDLDVAEQMLIDRYAFDPNHIVRLQDQYATRQGILEALTTLSQSAQSDDTVVIWFSGHAISEAGPVYLLPFDYDVERGENGIGAGELHHLLLSIPVSRMLIVLDAHAQQEMIDLATQSGAYTLALAEDNPGQPGAQEKVIDGRMYGVFSYALIQALTSKGNRSLAEIDRLVKQMVVKHGSRQVPLLVGDASLPIRPVTTVQLVLESFETSLRQNYAATTLGELQTLDKRVEQGIQAPYPPLYHSLGRGYIEKEAFTHACEALGKAKKQAIQVGYDDPELLLSLTIAQLREQRYADALLTLEEYVAKADEPSSLAGSLSVVKRISNRKVHA